MRPQYELADIIRLYGKDFIAQRPVLTSHQKVLRAIERCRTSEMGGHVERCTDCGQERISYNSCRNRHCPKCQGGNRDRWIEARQADILDCRYFHVVFTLPEALNVFCLNYPQEMYNLLFKSAKETLETFGRDERYLGADLGAVAVLHTWGQNLMLHPHIHLIVPAGGIDKNRKWKHTRTNGKYLFPVKAMSAVYRGKFMSEFKCFMEESGMELTGELKKKLYAKEWVVYAKRPFGGASQVIEYLGRYTHKVAISNHRLESIADGRVSFRYKDYRDDAKTKVMTLSADEFLRRFCLHILPRGFRKIRHYGILASRNKAMLRAVQEEMDIEDSNRIETLYSKKKTGDSRKQCPCCKTGRMETVLTFRAHAPPGFLLCNSPKPVSFSGSL
ncbi:IS91 family transposase [Bacteroides sp. 224]|uniref:IS91 family transposase n=1 Tax=Bacteroides sp. 224 TaxID=2302936 RepID=UPI0019402B74|nr:IS91 family transposase [Bacteroides sp. 224]